MIRLDVGCGRKLRDDHIGIDISPNSSATHCLDISKDVLPFDEGSVNSIYTAHTLEHLDGEGLIFAMNEFWRVLKWGGNVQIHVPHKDCDLAWQDPTHKSYFVEDSFKFFCGDYLIKHNLDYGIRSIFECKDVSLLSPVENKHYCSMISIYLSKSSLQYGSLCNKFPFSQYDKLSISDGAEPIKGGFAIPETKTIRVKDVRTGLGITLEEKAHIDRYRDHLKKADRIKVEKTKEYGTDPAPLGSMGLFADINRKFTRLKGSFWDSDLPTIKHDTIYDFVNYLIMTLMAWEDEQNSRREDND